jgi:ferredoxin
MGLHVEPLSKSVSQNADKCVHCGACTAFCPTGSLYFDRDSWKVLFDPEKCNGCELCVSACPARAMEVNLF